MDVIISINPVGFYEWNIGQMSVISCVQDYHNPFQTISLLLLLSNDVELNPILNQVKLNIIILKSKISLISTQQ